MYKSRPRNRARAFPDLVVVVLGVVVLLRIIRIGVDCRRHILKQLGVESW